MRGNTILKAGFIVAVACLLHSSYALAKQYTHAESISLYAAKNLQQPKAEPDGRVQTLNAKGAMSPALDLATQQFIKFGANKKVLEIGGAYGKVMLEMLTQYPGTEYHINDLDERHLFIAAHNLDTAKSTTSTHQAAAKVKYIASNVVAPDFATQEQYDAILVARVMHFFNPEQMDIAINNIKKSLKPHGRVYVIAISPYVKRYQAFIPEYEKRLANKEQYPGFVHSLAEWLNVEATSKTQQASISKEPFMFLDDKVLSKAFTKAGLKVIECKLVGLSYKSESWSLDGRENVILVAERQ
jgi:SAM-dependent methyltransferase